MIQTVVSTDTDFGSINVISIKLDTMVAFVEVQLFEPLSVTLTLFGSHSGITQLKMRVVLLGRCAVQFRLHDCEYLDEIRDYKT